MVSSSNYILQFCSRYVRHLNLDNWIGIYGPDFHTGPQNKHFLWASYLLNAELSSSTFSILVCLKLETNKISCEFLNKFWCCIFQLHFYNWIFLGGEKLYQPQKVHFISVINVYLKTVKPNQPNSSNWNYLKIFSQTQLKQFAAKMTVGSIHFNTFCILRAPSYENWFAYRPFTHIP